MKRQALALVVLFAPLSMAAFGQQPDSSSAYRALLCVEIMKELRYFDKLKAIAFDSTMESLILNERSPTIRQTEDLAKKPFDFKVALPAIPDLINDLDKLRFFHQKLQALFDARLAFGKKPNGKSSSEFGGINHSVAFTKGLDGYQVELKRYLPADALTAFSSANAPISMASPVITGATDFLINRAKDEVIYSFMVQLKDGIKDDRRMQTLFPETVALFGDFETLGARSLTSSLKSAVTSDFDGLGTRIMTTDAFVARKWHRPYLFVLGWLLRNYTQLRSGKDPVYVLADQAFPLVSSADKKSALDSMKLIKGLKIVREIALEMYSNDATKWSRIGDVVRLHQALRDAEFRGFFLRSLAEKLHQSNGPLSGISDLDLKAFIDGHYTDIIALINHVEELSQFAAKQSPLSKADTTTATSQLELYLRTVDKLFQIVEVSLRLGDGDKDENLVSEVRTVADKAMRLEKAIARRDYGQVTAVALDLFQTYYKRSLYILRPNGYTQIENWVDSKVKEDYMDSAVAVNAKQIFASIRDASIDLTNEQAVLDAPLNSLKLKIESIARMDSAVAVNVKRIVASIRSENIDLTNEQAVLDALETKIGGIPRTDSTVAVKIKQVVTFIRGQKNDPVNKRAVLDTLLNALKPKAFSIARDVVQDIKDEFTEAAAEAPVSQTMIRLMTLSANLATAKTPEDAESAFEAAVDPVGSFRAKRRDKFYFTVNAYVGLRIGQETQSHYPFEPFYGVSAPVGVEVGKGWNGWSTGIMASVFDFGNLISYRLKPDQVDPNPELGIRQILSPGLYAVVGITDALPLSAGLGVQYVPELRQSSTGKVNVTQFSFFLALDLALLRF